LDRNLTILIAEDDDNYQVILEKGLRDIGIKNPVRTARNGQEVIEYLKGFGEYGNREANPFPSVMFLDLKMPRASGLDVLRWMREHPECAVTPTMILSSSSLEKDVQAAYALGAHGYFVKPHTLDELKALLRAAYEFWRFSVRPPVPSKCSM